jgi:hypothetical protein
MCSASCGAFGVSSSSVCSVSKSVGLIPFGESDQTCFCSSFLGAMSSYSQESLGPPKGRGLCTSRTAQAIQVRELNPVVRGSKLVKTLFPGSDGAGLVTLCLGMTPIEIDAQADAWTIHRLVPAGSPEYYASAWATDTYDLLDEDPETVWLLIVAVHRKDQSIRVQQLLSAGEVEDLLGKHGDRFIDRIEAEARTDPSFAKLLGGLARSDERSIVGAAPSRVGPQRVGRDTGMNPAILQSPL